MVVGLRTGPVRRRACAAVTRLCACAVALVFGSASCLGMMALVTDGQGASHAHIVAAAYPLHDPIDIEGDDGFTEENGVVSGAGTAEDPYVIGGWKMDTSSLYWPDSAVRISNTTAAFVVSDIVIQTDEYTTSSFRGVHLVNVTSGTVDACVIEGATVGIGVQSSSGVNITGNRLVDTECIASGSDNVTVAHNVGCSAVVRISSSTNVSVDHNAVDYALARDTARGLVAEVRESDRCAVLGNTLWTIVETGVWGPGIILDSSTNCTVDGNAMNEQGISIRGYEKAHVSTLDIGPDNTVRMLPLASYRNTAGVTVDRAGFGQLIVANCSDVHLRDLALSGLWRPVLVSFCSDVEVHDCVFTDVYIALDIQESTDVRIRHNAFVDVSEVWARECSNLVFSDNDLASGQGGGAMFSASGLSDSAIEDNVFDAGSHEVYVSGSRNLTVRNNELPLMGLRLEGITVEEFTSHTIDGSNRVGGGKPVLYLKNQADLTVDLSNYSQLIMGDCSRVRVHGLATSASWALQLGFSEDVTVCGCRVYGSHPISLRYADNVTFLENDFVNPTVLMHLFMTHNVTTYHCNILGMWGGWGSGGFDGYTPTNIVWDNGYPDGGNYWEGVRMDDNYSGPNQDIPGPDGVGDRQVHTGFGSDRYPLMAPHVHGQPAAAGDVGRDEALWLSAIALIVLASSLVSYLLFIRERPGKTGPPGTDGQMEP